MLTKSWPISNAGAVVGRVLCVIVQSCVHVSFNDEFLIGYALVISDLNSFAMHQAMDVGFTIDPVSVCAGSLSQDEGHICSVENAYLISGLCC